MAGKRFSEIDFLRGFALLLMLFSNFLTDLSIFAIADYSFNFWLARFSAFLFIFISGISLHLSYEKAKKDNKATFLKFLKRGSFLFSLGLLITFATLIFFKQGAILFGILHFLGLSAILGYFLLRLDARDSLLLAILVFLSGIFLSTLRFAFPWLLWLGFIPFDFYSFDYFPLLPWFAFFALGIAFGKVFYPGFKRKFSQPKFIESSSLIQKIFLFLGRHTLAFYLAHQLIFVFVLSLLFPEKVFALARMPF